LSAVKPPETLTVTTMTLEVLQELQVALGVTEYPTAGRILEATLVWYDETASRGGQLCFLPPAGQQAWQPYARPLAIELDKLPPSNGPTTNLLVDGIEVQRHLAASEKLVRLAIERNALEQMVRLKAEEAFRRRDGWTIEVDDTNEGAQP
jgi:hypothetical protein